LNPVEVTKKNENSYQKLVKHMILQAFCIFGISNILLKFDIRGQQIGQQIFLLVNMLTGWLNFVIIVDLTFV